MHVAPPSRPIWFSDTGGTLSTPQGTQTFHIRHQDGAWPPTSTPEIQPGTPPSRWRQRTETLMMRARGQVPVGWNMRLDVVAGKGVVRPELLFATPRAAPVGQPRSAGVGRGLLPMTVAHFYAFTPHGDASAAPCAGEALPDEVAAATGVAIEAGLDLYDELEPVRLTDVGTLSHTASVGTYRSGDLRLSRRLPDAGDAAGAEPAPRRLMISTHGSTQSFSVPLPEGMPVTFLGPNEVDLSGRNDFLETGSFYARLERSGEAVTVTSGAPAALEASLRGNLFHMAGSAIPGHMAEISLTPYGTPDDHHWTLQRQVIGTHAQVIAAAYGDIDVLTLAPGTRTTLSQAVRDVTSMFGADYAEIVVFACRGNGREVEDVDEIHEHRRNWTAAERPVVRTHFSVAGGGRPVPTLEDSPAKLLDAVLGKVNQRGEPSNGMTLGMLTRLSDRPALAGAIGQRLQAHGIRLEADAGTLAAVVDRLCDEPRHSASSLRHLADVLGDAMVSWLFTEAVLREGQRPGLDERVDAFLAALPDISRAGRAGMEDSRWVSAILELIQSPALSPAQRLSLLRPQSDAVMSWAAYAVEFPRRSVGIDGLGPSLARLPLADSERAEILMMQRGDQGPALLHALSKTDHGDRIPYPDSIRLYDGLLASSGLTPEAQAAVVADALCWRTAGGTAPLSTAMRPAEPGEEQEEAIRESHAALKDLLARLPFTAEQKNRIDAAARQSVFDDGSSPRAA